MGGRRRHTQPGRCAVTVSMLVDGEWVHLSDAEHTAMLLDELRADGAADPCPDCFTPRSDGVCRACRTQAILDADPDWSAMADAQGRLDDGDYDLDERPALNRTVDAFWAKQRQAEIDTKTEVNACGWCNRPQAAHTSLRWDGHAYMPPRDDVRLRRLYAHRAVRLGLPPWSRPGPAKAVAT